MAFSGYSAAFVICQLPLLLLVSATHLASTTNTAAEIKSEAVHESRFANLRRIARQTVKGNGNGLIDEVIPTWKKWLQENGYDPLFVKFYEVNLDPIIARLSDCDINGLTSFRRTGDVTVNASDTAFAAEANVGLDKLTAKCKVEIRWSVLRGFGTLNADVADFAVEASVIQIRPPPRMTSLRITNPGTINVEFLGKGFVGTILQWAGQGYLKYRLFQFLDDTERIISIVNEAISGVDIENAVDLL